MKLIINSIIKANNRLKEIQQTSPTIRENF